MQTYLVRLRCRSPYLTPWRNTTLWGRLAWIVADGRLPGSTIVDWIDLTREGSPLLVVGDAFPSDAFPVPAIYLARTDGAGKKPKTLPWKNWLDLCRTGTWPELSAEIRSLPRVERAHVVLSRESGAALLIEDPERPEEKRGQLRTEIGWQPLELMVVAQVDDTLGRAGLETLMVELCKDGWGQGRTYGYGHVELAGIEEVERPAPTGWVATLGHCHPTDDLPQEGFWRWTGVPVRPHDPNSRKGEREFFATMLLPGASFACDAAAIGRAVGLPHQDRGVQMGVAPTWPVKGGSDA